MEILLSYAVDFVRARMDELSFSNDDMILPDEDDRNFDNTVEKLLPEAVEAIVRSAPAALLEPESEIRVACAGDATDGIESSELLEDGSVRVSVRFDSGFLRLVAFKCDDSDIYLTSFVPFDSPKARMQANPYARGTWDDPVLVERKTPERMVLTYHSVKDPEDAPGFTMYKIDRPSYIETEEEVPGSTETVTIRSMFVPEQLGNAVLNRLVGMVLETYRETQLAQTFYQKSNSYIQ